MLPKRVRLGAKSVVTDVVEQAGTAPDGALTGANFPQFPAGGPVSNVTSSGTFGCLVTRQGSPFVHALTNRHVAIGEGNIVFFPAAQVAGSIAARVSEDLDLIPDEQFLAFSDETDAYVDVDAALIIVPKPALSRFSPVPPVIGAFSGIFPSESNDLAEFSNKHLGLSVRAWSWRSGLRVGTVDYVNYHTRRPDGPIVIYSLVISGRGAVPSVAMDSGKSWVTDDGEIVGLHQGAITIDGNECAVATAMSPIFSRLHLSLAR
jgi:hypothetical protein